MAETKISSKTAVTYTKKVAADELRDLLGVPRYASVSFVHVYDKFDGDFRPTGELEARWVVTSEKPPEPTEHPFCHAASDGECHWKDCPQLRDDEPKTSGRHCPLDNAPERT